MHDSVDLIVYAWSAQYLYLANIIKSDDVEFYIHHTYAAQLGLSPLGFPQQLAVSSDVLWPLKLLPQWWDVSS